jgi:hypothetical protein
VSASAAHTVVSFPTPDLLHCDEIPCCLNPLQAIDLKQILLMTPAERRLAVACAFAGFDMREAFIKVGLAALREKKGQNGDVTWRRWIRRVHPMPLGAGFRLAALFGVPAELLVEWFV